ncbi:HNH endonuclease [Spirosoma aerophilum]
MSIKQNDFCPYCGTKIEYDGYGEPLEHIIDKGRHPEWMFEPKNLVLSCYACNTQKSTKDVMIFGCHTGNDYPTDSSCIKVIHPYFDTYLDHIEIVDDIFIKALNNGKGWCTIDTFGLLRLQLPMKKAHALSIGDNVVAKATEALRNPNLPTYLIQHFEELILDLVTRYNEMAEDQNEN